MGTKKTPPRGLEQLLFEAVHQGLPEVIASAIGHGADVDADDGRGLRPVHHAICLGRHDALRALLDGGASVGVGSFLSIPLLYAITATDVDDPRIIELLVDGGADVDGTIPPNGYTPLMLAVICRKPRSVRALVAAGADVNRSDSSGKRPLDRAVTDCSSLLIRPGAPTITDDDELAVIDALLEAGAEPDYLSENFLGKSTALIAAVANPSFSLAQLLGERQRPEPEPALEVLRGIIPIPRADEPVTDPRLAHESSIVERLLAHGAEPDLRDAKGRTALFHAIDRGASTLVARLLEAGAEVNARDAEGMTPLMVTARYDDRATLELLLEAGAELDERDDEGRTALYYAVVGGRLGSVGALLDAGANARLATFSRGVGPLDLAVMRYNLPLVEALVTRSDDLVVSWGKGALLRAVMFEQIEIVRVFLRRGIGVGDPTLQTLAEKLRSPALLELMTGGEGDIVYKLDWDGVVLEEHGPPLHKLAAYGEERFVRYLLDIGANVNERDDKGETALCKALRNGHAAIAAMLRDAGAEE